MLNNLPDCIFCTSNDKLFAEICKMMNDLKKPNTDNMQNPPKETSAPTFHVVISKCVNREYACILRNLKKDLNHPGNMQLGGIDTFWDQKLDKKNVKIHKDFEL